MSNGVRIKSLKQLEQAVINKKAVDCPNTNFRRIPAAVMINLQGTLLLRLFNQGMFVYKKTKKEVKQ